MKNSFILIAVLVLIVLVVLLFIGKGTKLEAPAPEDNNGAVSQGMPTLEEPDTEEMIAEGNSGAVKEFTVSGQNFSFSPSLITVEQGDKVKITFKNTSGFHDFKIDEFGVAAKQANAPATEVLEFTADRVGSFEYYCSVGSHRSAGMKGTLKVE